MELLLASVLALLAGPLCYKFMSQRREYLALLDGFVFVSILGLLIIEIVPSLLTQTSGQSGWPVWVFMLVGIFGPDLLEKLFKRSARQVHLSVLILAVAGLGLHAVFDGIALPHVDHDHAHQSLGYAIVLHRIPVAITIWWLLRPALGKAWATGVLSLVAVGTVAGFFAGGSLLPSLDGEYAVWFQAFIAGAILHVVFNRPHLGDVPTSDHDGCAHSLAAAEARQKKREQWMEGVGNALGVAALFALFALEGEALQTLASWDILQRFYSLALVSAPALLMGYTLAGLLSAYMPGAPLKWLHRGGIGVQAGKGMAVGLPLPICSCGVVPLFDSLVARGAPPAAALAFLVATPELGIDALLLSVPLLGAELTVIRLVVAAALAFSVAVIVTRLFKPQSQVAAPVSGCCGDDADGSDDGHSHVEPQKPGGWKKALNDGLVELVDHTAPWIMLGLVIAAVAAPLLENSALTAIPSPWDVLIFAAVGMPIYVCATGSTPIAAVFIAAGVSPGAGLAFLLTGPATNVTTFGILRSRYGSRTAMGFAVVMLVGAVFSGIVVNTFFGNITLPPLAELHEHTTWWRELSLLLVGLLVLGSILRRGLREFVATLNSGQAEPHDHAH